MNYSQLKTERLHSILAFSLLSAYILSFLFEGQVLYLLLDQYQLASRSYIILAISAHFLGLFSCGFFTKTIVQAKQVMILGIASTALALLPFFFAPSFLWKLGLLIGGYASGCALAAWGYFLKELTPQAELLKTCASVLILANVIMIAINVLSVNSLPSLGLAIIMLCLLLGIFSALKLPSKLEEQATQSSKKKLHSNLTNALLLLCAFITILTINSGLMYEVINPAFEQVTNLVSWYWAIPYIIALLFMGSLPAERKRSQMLYVAMIMIAVAFISFMFLGRTARDYFLINTLMMAACGIFDLFWWSILAEMLVYTENPSAVFGLGLSANVFGVLSGGIIGILVTSTQRLTAEVTVMALAVVCVTLVLLPLLNRHLVLLLKEHAYLESYDQLNERQQTAIIHQTQALDPLTAREEEVLQLILSGKSNREIAASLYITENTVKTHTRNIYSKFAVHSRAELISNLLQGKSLN